MVKRFGLKSSNDCLNDNGIENTNSMSMRTLNAKRPPSPILTLTVIFTNTDCSIFSELSQMDSLTTKRYKTAPKSTQYGVK